MDAQPGLIRLWFRDVAEFAVTTGIEVLTVRPAEQSSGSGVMTVDTIEVGVHADQGIVVTIRSTTGRTGGIHQRLMVRYGHVDRIPVAEVTNSTVANNGNILTDCITPGAAIGIVTALTTYMCVCSSTV